MKAVILAAGRGSRLRPYTDDLPKALIPIGGTTLAHRTVAILRSLGITDVTIVVGHLKEKFARAFRDEIVRFEVNDHFDTTDQAASLLMARAAFDDDLLVVTGDLCCPPQVFEEIVHEGSPVCIAVDRTPRDFDDTIEKVRFEGERVVRIGKLNVGNAEANGEFMGLTKFRRDATAAALGRIERAVVRNARSALIHVHQDFIDGGSELGYVEARGEWCEVDDEPSLAQARRLLTVCD
jgi:choline kinase